MVRGTDDDDAGREAASLALEMVPLDLLSVKEFDDLGGDGGNGIEATSISFITAASMELVYAELETLTFSANWPDDVSMGSVVEVFDKCNCDELDIVFSPRAGFLPLSSSSSSSVPQ